MNVRFLILALLAGHAGLASAQQMYKCGNTFSQTPCAPDAVARPVQPSAAPETPAGGLAGYELCAAAARKMVRTPEPETARIQPIGERRSEVIQYAGKPIATHRYDLSVDAKTPYGVYSGLQPYACWLSEDQRRVLQFRSLRD
ncbi:DUF4124 domain-containing protein [Piscinibacter sp. HJYY11]|uniref:DUF4124 domain-containing protein n=1 Tax=Piscinibacter sp. HJYY11 TaxID=2801333 RepID=UPI00191E40F0|nr:DUF4124 domain-containing protein [Piscinibacter sp. HJYY11]MBL0726450.1 DUF4124 domain-containing protein [Piscinibacter sp. HJYY11]